MDILVVQALCLIGLFLSTLILTVIPVRLMGKRDRSLVYFGKYELLISFANCLSGGVFLATFFVGLLPEVRKEIDEMLHHSGITTSIPITEVIILIGFFVAMFVEQLAISVKDFHKSKKRKSREVTVGDVNVAPANETEHSSLEANNLRSDGLEDDEEEAVEPVQHLEDSSNPMVNINKALNAGNQTNHCNHNDMENHQLEHIHSHHEAENGHGHSHNVDVLVLQSMAGFRLGILLLSLGVHCLFEGIALGLQNEIHTLVNLFIGIWIHECLIALALGFSMVRARPETCRMVQIAVFFSILIPLGQVIGIIIGSSQSWTSRVVSTVLQGIAAGTFVQVTFLDIIPEGLGSVGSPKRLVKVGLLFLGFFFSAVISILVEMYGVHEH